MEENKEKELEETAEETAEEAENEQLKEALKKAEEYKDKFLRVSAEFDNFRKRTVKEKETLYSDGKASAVAEFLPLADNMERALEAVSAESDRDSLAEGLEKIAKQLSDILKSLSVEEIAAVGEQFDPELHNAVMHIEDDEKENNTIVEEFQKGYTLNGKVIRHSMVSVAN
ncbi:MAG: nucleotide exchange factor GrpE [Clostridia bacterium]|nr:nucleotide exchange factor GrpE [Clostridia bacterium]